jgi:hypothetical protein
MRDLTFEISVKGAEQAEAAVAKVEQRMVAAGRAGEQASVGVQKFEQAAQRTSGTVVQADRATQALQQSTVATTRSMGTLTTATTAAGTATTKTTGSIYEQVKAMIAADVAAMQMTSATEAATVAQTGLFAQVSAGITKFAPYAVAAQVVVGILVDWYEAHERAAVAAETLAAKQDTIARASKLAGTTIRTYGDAVKYMNEQFQRTPAFVDNASDALSHWNIAVQKGPLNARNFAAGDLVKNIGDAAKTVQDELSRIGMDTAQKAMDLLREKTVLGSAAFNQWAKDIGLSSVTIDVLREQVQAEEKAEQNYQRTLDRTTRATNGRTEATKAAVISMKELADVTAMRNRAGGTTLQEIFPFTGPEAPDYEVLPPSSANIDRARLGNLRLRGGRNADLERADQGNFLKRGLADVGNSILDGFSSMISGGITNLINIGLSTLVRGIGRLFGNPSQQELAGRDAERSFEQRFGGFTQMMQAMGQAGSTLGMAAPEIQAAVQAMLQSESQGADAVNAAIANLQGILDHAETVRRGAAQFGMSQTELNTAASSAKDVYDYMVRLQQQGEYTQDQVNAAYLAWQKSMAAAGNEAAKAWVEAQSAAKAGASGPISAMQSEMERLRASIANEAPEDVKGVIETQVEGQIAALKAQMDEQQRAMADSAKTGAEDAVTEIKDTFSDLVLHVPVIYDFPRVQGLPQPEIPEPVPMADGGIGRVTKPTLFLAGEAGPEDFAFSGGNRAFAPAGRSNTSGAPVTVNVVLNNPAFDTPAGRRRTMDQIGQAMVEALRREGRMVV